MAGATRPGRPPNSDTAEDSRLAALETHQRAVAGTKAGPVSYVGATGITVDVSASLASVAHAQFTFVDAPAWSAAFAASAVQVYTSISGTTIAAKVFAVNGNGALVAAPDTTDLHTFSLTYVAVGTSV